MSKTAQQKADDFIRAISVDAATAGEQRISARVDFNATQVEDAAEARAAIHAAFVLAEEAEVLDRALNIVSAERAGGGCPRESHYVCARDTCERPPPEAVGQRRKYDAECWRIRALAQAKEGEDDGQ